MELAGKHVALKTAIEAQISNLESPKYDMAAVFQTLATTRCNARSLPRPSAYAFQYGSLEILGRIAQVHHLNAVPFLVHPVRQDTDLVRFLPRKPLWHNVQRTVVCVC